MKTLRHIAHTILPYRLYVILRNIKQSIQAIHRRFIFRVAFTEFLKLDSYDHVDKRLLDRLIYGWGNEAYSASAEYISACLHSANQNKGPILECGSGLSTLLLGVVAARHNNQVWSFEHNHEWAYRVKNVLSDWNITSVQLLVDPLQPYGDFDWYRIPAANIPQEFRLVICDGPPGYIHGGRYGLVPVMAKHLASNSTILLDDYQRPDEQAIVRRWQEEMPCIVKSYGISRMYAAITITA